MGSDGRPLAGAMVMLRARSSGGVGALRMNIVNGGGNQVRPDGSFQLTNVPPGDYVLDVQQRPQNIRNLQDINLSPAGVRVDAGQRVGGHRQSHRRHHPGRDGVRTRGLSGAERADDNPTMQVVAVPPSGGPSPIGDADHAKALGGGRVGQDSTFELRGIAGPQMIRVQGVPAGWMLKSITLDGTDITDGVTNSSPAPT